MPYQPPQEIIDKYADVLVNFALNSGEGIAEGEVVRIVVPDIAKPLALALQNNVLEAGAHPMIRLIPTEFNKDFYTLADDDQLTFFPEEYLKAQAELLDHQIGIIADPDPFELKDVDPKKIFRARNSKKQYRDWLIEKESHGNYTWTAALWGVEAKAEMVGLSLEEYWEQIIKACYLDADDPIAEWNRVQDLQESVKQALNDLRITWLHVQGEDIDLKVQLGEDREWLGGSGRNIPSFELFVSPDWRGTEGHIKFDQPLYRFGNVIEGIELTFEDGLIVEATATQNESLLKEMIRTPNANKIGEYSLTDSRMSRITHVMAETLYDENIGGPQGNTHLAVGMAYKESFRGDESTLTKEEWDDKGFNDSAEHTDIISTAERRVTATTADGEEVVIYENGQFTVGGEE